MKNNLLKKSMVFSLMVFFIVGGVNQSIEAGDIIKIDGEKEIYVDDDAICPGKGTLDAPYCSIRYAIENASGKTTIKLANGTYYENVFIYKDDITINPYDGDINGSDQENPTIDGSKSGSVIEIRGENIELDSIDITNSGDFDDCTGIYIGMDAHNTRIIKCHIYDCYQGIRVDSFIRGFTDHDFKENIIHDITYNGIFVDWQSSFEIFENHIYNCGYAGILLRDCNDGEIYRNVVENNKVGIYIDVSDSNEIHRNRCTKNELWGILIINDMRSTVRNNDFFDNGKALTKKRGIVNREEFKQAIFAHFKFIQTTWWTQNYWGVPKYFIKIIPGQIRWRIDIPWFWFELFPSQTPNTF